MSRLKWTVSEEALKRISDQLGVTFEINRNIVTLHFPEGSINCNGKRKAYSRLQSYQAKLERRKRGGIL